MPATCACHATRLDPGVKNWVTKKSPSMAHAGR